MEKLPLFVKWIDGWHAITHQIIVSSTSTVEQLKKQIQTLKKSPGNILRLIWAGKQLQNQKKLSDYNMQKYSTIHVDSSRLVRAGGCQNIIFNSLDQPVVLKFSEKAPKWRVIADGLNLQGKCIQKKCIAFDSKVWVQKGFGIFNLNKQIAQSKCPICQNFLENVDNLGIHMASMKIAGMLSENKTKITKKYQMSHDFLTFQDKDEAKLSWIYLELNVQKFGQIID